MTGHHLSHALRKGECGISKPSRYSQSCHRLYRGRSHSGNLKAFTVWQTIPNTDTEFYMHFIAVRIRTVWMQTQKSVASIFEFSKAFDAVVLMTLLIGRSRCEVFPPNPQCCVGRPLVHSQCNSVFLFKHVHIKMRYFVSQTKFVLA